MNIHDVRCFIRGYHEYVFDEALTRQHGVEVRACSSCGHFQENVWRDLSRSPQATDTKEGK